jgi:nucleoside diphosphate kinase
MNKLIDLILSSIDNFETEALNHLIYSSENRKNTNEFLFILKPELFVHTSTSQKSEALNLIFEKFEKFDFQIDAVRIINAAYLNKHSVMASHYGVINSAARNINSTITQEATENFKQIYGLEYSTAKVYGAIELIEQNIMDVSTLTELWKEVDIKRLAGGIYSGKVNYEGKVLYIVNGFHPPQLEHFIAEGRIIVCMNISSSTNWATARQDLIGNTYPEKASLESIRGALYEQYHKFGFDQVSYVLNSVHLSAGPLEGLVELQRFNSVFENNEQAKISDFHFGKLLEEHFTTAQLEQIISNPTVKYEGKPKSLFDLTEEMDSIEAIKTLQMILF